MRRLLVSTLVAVMVLAFGGAAFAAATTVSAPAFTDIAGHEAEFELTALKAYNIFAGDAGTTLVRPNDTITRAEVAKVLVTMLGRHSIAQGMAGVRPSFKDEVPTWAWGFVNCAQVMGLVQGYEDGTFKAGNQVTYAEVITMLVRAVPGHREQVPAGFWPYNYLFHAIDHGFTGAVDMGFAGLPAPRGDVARLAFASMQVDKLSLATGTFGQPIADSAILAGSGSGQLGYVYTGVVTNYDLAGNRVELGGASRDLAASVYLVGASNFEGLMHLSVIAAANKAGQIMAIGRTQAVSTFSGIFDYIDTSVSTAYKLAFKDGTKITLPYGSGGTPTPARVNQDLRDVEALPQGAECVVTRDAAGKASFVNALIMEYTDYVANFTKSVGGATPVDTQFTYGYGGGSDSIPASARVSINGALANRDDLRNWDVAEFAWNWSTGKLLEIRATRRVVEGKPTTVRTSYPGPKYYATIGGTEYYTGDATNGLGLLNTSTTYKLGLDKSSMTFVQIGLETATPFARIKGYTAYGDGSATVTVDVRGVSSTYAVPNTSVVPNGSTVYLRDLVRDQVGGFAWIKINERNELIDFVAVTGFGTAYAIVSNSSGGITLDKTAGTYEFIPASAGIACYKGTAYVETAALGVGANYKLAKAAMGTAYNFDGAPDTITVTLYSYTTP